MGFAAFLPHKRRRARSVRNGEIAIYVKGTKGPFLLRVLNMSAVGMPPRRDFVMSAHADYRHDHLMFERQQSQTLRERDWEGRLKPMASWSALALRGVAILLLTTAMVAMLV